MEADASPFPSELTTPPVTKIYLALIRLLKISRRVGGRGANGLSCALSTCRARALAQMSSYRSNRRAEGIGTSNYPSNGETVSTANSPGSRHLFACSFGNSNARKFAEGFVPKNQRGFGGLMVQYRLALVVLASVSFILIFVIPRVKFFSLHRPIGRMASSGKLAADGEVSKQTNRLGAPPPVRL